MKMKELFDRGEFAVSAEVGPPKGIHVDELVEEAKTYLKEDVYKRQLLQDVLQRCRWMQHSHVKN